MRIQHGSHFLLGDGSGWPRNLPIVSNDALKMAEALDKRMTLFEFSDEVKEHSLSFPVIEGIIPAWVNHVGSTGQEIISLFIEIVGPQVCSQITEVAIVNKSQQ